jgi:hypothetical protein
MSRFFPHFEDDIFINYAWADNVEPRDDKNRGWVDALHENLWYRLKQLTGIDPVIWRDKEKMPGNAFIDLTLGDKVRRVALLVSILSPSYLTSEWCIKELNEFYQWATKSSGIPVDNKSRIFKVIKTPIAKEKHPQEMQDLPGYNFYELYPNGMPREYSHIHGFDGYQDFIREVQVLAWEISRFAALYNDSNPYPRTVYLAETISDLKAERDEIKYELEAHDYHILPDKPLPTDGVKFREAVRDYMKRSRLSIHLVGGEPGFMPEGDRRDVVHLQHSLALEHQSSADFFRIVWTPFGLKAHGPAQQKFIHSLRTRARFQKDAELLLGNTKLGNLKTYILQKLKSLEPPQPEAAPGARQGVNDCGNDREAKSIYLIFDKKDLKAVRPLHSFLGKKYKVTWPVMEPGVKRAREEHRRNLSECDVAIIFYGQAKESWVRANLDELEKIIVDTRTKPRPLSTLYITGPLNEAKEFYETSLGYQVVKNPGEFSEESLQPLLSEIQRRSSQNKSEGVGR